MELMAGTDDDSEHGEPDPKIWGRRPYAGKDARERLNDVSRYIARTRPDDVDDPDDPTLAEVVAYADAALTPPNGSDDDPKAATLSALMRSDLTFQEAVCWYWFRYCQYDITEIHFAMTGNDTGGDPDQRRNATRNILSTLRAAARKIPDADEDAIPDLVDERKRHDRTPDPTDS